MKSRTIIAGSLGLFLALAWSAFLMGADSPTGTTIGVEWDDAGATSPVSFKFFTGFAAAPGEILRVNLYTDSATTAASEIADEVNAAHAGTAWLCTSRPDVVMFDGEHVGDMGILDNGVYIEITTSQLTLSNGMTVRKVSICPNPD